MKRKKAERFSPEAQAEIDRLRVEIEALTQRIDRLITQARRQGIVLPGALDRDDLYSAIELMHVLGVSRARVYQLASRPTFPEPVRPGRWRLGEVLDWDAARKQA